MSTQEILYRIVDGPNRNDFVNSFLYAKDENLGRDIATYTVEISPTVRREVTFKLNKISHEDGSGHSFNFKGECFYYRHSARSINVRGYYNARSRTGTITPLDGERIPSCIVCP